MGSVEGFRSDIAGAIDQTGSCLVKFLPCEVLAVFGQIRILGFIIALRARGVCTGKETVKKKRNNARPCMHEDRGCLSSCESSSVLWSSTGDRCLSRTPLHIIRPAWDGLCPSRLALLSDACYERKGNKEDWIGTWIGTGLDRNKKRRERNAFVCRSQLLHICDYYLCPIGLVQFRRSDVNKEKWEANE
jgi:hypothetical protein